MKQKKIATKIMAFVLLAMNLLSMGIIPTQAASIGDGKSTEVTIDMGTRYTYLESTDGTAFGGEAWTYTTNDGISGGAYCINWGLKGVPSNKKLPISGLYTANPATIGAFASGYPQRSLDDFLTIYLADNPQLSGLTEAEFGYSTQIAVWATLGQIAVEGTVFTEGRKTLAIPYSDPQKIRTFKALEIILDNASYWDKPLKHSLEIRNEKNSREHGIDVQSERGLFTAATTNSFGIKRETINGKEYFTRPFTTASGTSTWKHGYNIEMWVDNAPSGTIFVGENNEPLNTVEWDGKTLYQVPTVIHSTDLNANESEYWGTFKIAIPVNMTEGIGDITIHATSTVNQYNIYFANNTDHTEQSYVIADPLYSSIYASTYLRWTTEESIFGRILVHKIDDMGMPLAGALFNLEGSDGSVHTATSNVAGLIEWDLLDPAIQYVVREKQAPQGYRLAAPVNVSVIANETVNLTIKNESNKNFRLRKIDAQNGYPLGQAVFRFEQIDGNYSTDAITGHDGYISFVGGELPFGSYKVYEVQSPNGYEKDMTAQTVNWNGQKDVMLTFKNVRTMSLVLIKADFDTKATLEGAVFKLYKDGAFITTATTNSAGEIRFSNLEPGYYEVEEQQSPKGYILDSRRHGINIDPYNTATTADPLLVVTNKAKGALEIRKIDSTDSNKGLDGVVLRIQNASLGIDRQYTTANGGYIKVSGLEPADYIITEVATIPGYELSKETVIVSVKYGETANAIFKNEPHGKITLIKVDSITGKHLAGANIKLTDIDGKTWDVTTGADGTATISDLPKGEYTVQEQNAPPHYELNSVPQTVIVKPGETSSVKIQNNPLGTMLITKIDIKTGLPMAGVKLRIYSDSLNYDKTETTDSRGQISLIDLKPSDYTISEVATIPGYELSKEVITKAVAYGHETTVTFTNSPKGSAQVIKVDSVTGKHLAGANIKFTNLATNQTWDLTTGTDGTATVNDLAAGHYTFQEQNAPLHYELNNQVFNVTVVNGERSTVKIQNNPLGTMLITKIDIKTGLPMAGVRLRIYSDILNYDRTETTDSKGQIHLTDLTPADYVISEVATIPGYELSTEILVKTVKYGQETTAVFGNAPLGSTTVIKVDSITGEHLKGANIKLTNPATGQTWDVITGADGTATVTDLSAGEYYWQEQNPPAHYELNNQTFPVTVVVGEDSTVKIQNNPLGSLLITKVSSKDGTKSLSGVKLRIYSDILNYDRTETTDSKGQIHLADLTPADYAISEVATIQGYELSTEILIKTVSYGKETTAVFKNNPLGSTTVIKVDSITGEHLQGANIKLTNPATGQTWDVITGTDGTATISDLSAGEYYWQEQNPPAHYELNNQTFPVMVVVGEDSAVKIQNNPLGKIEITKVNSLDATQTLEGVKLRVQNTALGFDKTYSTDKNGKILIDDLTPADYTISEVATILGFVLSDETIVATVNYGKVTPVVFKNEPKPYIEILKIDSQNNLPISGAHFLVTNKNTRQTYNVITDEDGKIIIPDVDVGWYEIFEVTPPTNYVPDDTVDSVFADIGKPGKIIIKNTKMPSLTVLKVDKDSQKLLSGGIFSIEKIGEPFAGKITGSPFTTDADGKIYISSILPGSYRITEEKPPYGYNLSENNSQIITIVAGQDNIVKFENTRQPSFILTKTDSRTNAPIEGAFFTIEKVDNPGKGFVTGTPLMTDENGQIIIPNLLSGVYRVIETEPQNGYGFPTQSTWEINIIANQDYNLRVKNTRLPSLVINKKDGLTFRGIPNVAFEVFYAANGSMYGDMRSLGTFVTDKNGQIVIPNCQVGWYQYVETRPAQGYSKPSNPTHSVFLSLGDNAYSGVGGDAWLEQNGIITVQAVTAKTETNNTPVIQEQAEKVEPTPTPTVTATLAPTPEAETTITPTTTPPPTSNDSGLKPTEANIPILIPTKANGNR